MKNKSMKKLLRRDFLKLGARSMAALGGASVMGRMSQVSALAQTACPTDYKALVCVFLFGGNDSNNMLIPIASKSNPTNTYQNYANIRGGLALSPANLNMIGTSLGDQYGLHPELKDVASMYNSKKVAVLANVGSLVNILTQTSYQKKQAPIPSNLFSHLDQQIEWQTSQAQGFATTGWGGNIADVMVGCTPSTFPMVMSLDGNVIFGTGAKTAEATIGTGTIAGLTGFTTCQTDARSAALCNLLSFDNGLSLVQASNKLTSTGIQQANTLIANVKPVFTAPPPPPNTPANPLTPQLAQVANLINARSALGPNRQIFFTYLGGFDTHDMELNNQDTLLRQLNDGLAYFYTTLQQMGLTENVVTFTESEFSRTMQPSGGATLGTDHAWGGHHIIMGDQVLGGDLYGTFPTQMLGGPDDATGGPQNTTNARGIWIPTTPVDQYGAALATWFGVPNTRDGLGKVFPNLINFNTLSPLAFMHPLAP